MTNTDEMGLTPAAAEGYEALFVPAIFGQWPPVFADAAAVASGATVLDAGCGTGVLARALLQRVGAAGRVVGVDLSSSMLGVARSRLPQAEFVQGSVTNLTFPDHSFDAVCGAFMLMFVDDPQRAVAELWRVLRPAGRLVLGVWQALDANPVYSVLVQIVENEAGAEAAQTLAWPFKLGADDALHSLLQSAGLNDVAVSVRPGTATFPSIEALVRTEIEAWLLAAEVEPEVLEKIIAEAQIRLAAFAPNQGEMTFPFNALVAVVQKPTS